MSIPKLFCVGLGIRFFEAEGFGALGRDQWRVVELVVAQYLDVVPIRTHTRTHAHRWAELKG